jgi:hypothetical protein
MQEFYFHLCPIILKNGSVIKTGNWGRVLKTYHKNIERCGLLIG